VIVSVMTHRLAALYVVIGWPCFLILLLCWPMMCVFHLPMQGHWCGLYFLLFMVWHCIVYALAMQGLQSSLHCIVYALARSKEKKFGSLVHAFVYGLAGSKVW